MLACLAFVFSLRSSLALLSIYANLAGKIFQDPFREHTGGLEAGSFFHQLHKNLFPVLSDRGKAVDIDHKLTTIQIRWSPFATGSSAPQPKGR